MSLLLSRTLDPTDYDHLTEELTIVDASGMEGQHPHRRWEYALALHAIWRWEQARRGPHSPIYDVGGGGCRFWDMLVRWTNCEVQIIDPAEKDSRTLEEHVAAGAELADIVTCISVIEHVPALEEFLYYLSCLVAPGGLLVLTMDFWNRCGPDLAVNREQRRRIFCPKSYAQLRTSCLRFHLQAFGGVDPRWHGAHVHDYTFASLVLVKQP